MKHGSIRVLVVDDSAIAREVIIEILGRDPALTVVGVGADGQQAIELAGQLQPDILVMDLAMPVLDGLEATKAIMATYPCPILLVTSISSRREGQAAFRALSLGALDVIAKPRLGDGDGSASAFLRKVRTLSTVKSLHALKRPPRPRVPSAEPSSGTTPAEPLPELPVERVVAMAASTGGPGAVLSLLRTVPKGLAAAWVLVHHIADGFHADLAAHLARAQTLDVVVAQQQQRLSAGQLLLAPGGRHMVVSASGRVSFDDRPPVRHQKPSGNLLLDSVAQAYGRRAIGVILTGMGDDGAEGIAAIRGAGGTTIAQDEATSTIFGMPRAAIELNVVDHVLPVDRIGPRIASLVRAAAAPVGS